MEVEILGKSFLSLCYKTANRQLVSVATAEVSSNDCAMNWKFFAWSQLPWDDIVGYFFPFPCWRVCKCLQTMFVLSWMSNELEMSVHFHSC